MSHVINNRTFIIQIRFWIAQYNQPSGWTRCAVLEDNFGNKAQPSMDRLKWKLEILAHAKQWNTSRVCR
jgi:hypothetical protein